MKKNAKTGEATELEGPVVGLIPASDTLSDGSYLGSLDTSVGRCWWWFFPGSEEANPK